MKHGTITEGTLSENNIKHRCPKCGSERIESYKDEDTVYIKCEECGYVMSKYNYRPVGINYGAVIPLFFGMAVFAVVFALLMRLVMFFMGISV